MECGHGHCIFLYIPKTRPSWATSIFVDECGDGERKAEEEAWEDIKMVQIQKIENGDIKKQDSSCMCMRDRVRR